MAQKPQRQKVDCNGAFIFVQFHAIHHICKLAIMEPAMPSRLADAVMNPSTPTPRDNSFALVGMPGPVQAMLDSGLDRI